MSSVASAAVRENGTPLVKGRQSRKFTPDNIARIKEWVAQGVRRDEIASRLEVTVGSLQVTCSKLGVSLRTSSLAKASGAIQPVSVVQRSIGHVPQGDRYAGAKFALLIQKHSRQAVFDLPLHHNLIEQLALEASARGQSVAVLIEKILSQVIEKNLVGEILRNGNSPSKV
jgi:hypothetical protein